MCQRSPGPRCASHARKAVQTAAKELATLDKEGADEKDINKAKKTLAEAIKIYDSTPTGQKKLTEKIEELKGTGESTRSLTARRTAGKRLREQQEQELAKVVAQEREAAARAERLEEMREEEANKPANPFKSAVAGYVLREGKFLKEQYWGGPSPDYEAKEHLDQCGVLHTGNASENYTWQTYDSFSTSDRVGFSMNTTCSCGEIFERPIVVENATMSSVMQGILNE